jgi:hypothetical protein
VTGVQTCALPISIKLFEKQVSISVFELIIILFKLVFFTYDFNKLDPDRFDSERFAAPRSAIYKVELINMD